MQAVTLILEAEHSIEVKEQVSAHSASCLRMVLHTEFILQLDEKPALWSSYKGSADMIIVYLPGPVLIQMCVFSGVSGICRDVSTSQSIS